MNNAQIFPFFLFLSVIVVLISSFTTVSLWSNAKRAEREAFYKSEMVRRFLELQPGSSDGALQILREENLYQHRRRSDRSRLMGLVTGGTGLGLLIFLLAMLRTVTTQPVYLVALIPMFIGAALVLYSYFIRTTEPS